MGHGHSHAAGRAEDRCAAADRAGGHRRGDGASRSSARCSPARWRCWPTPATWPPTRRAWCSRWASYVATRRSAPAGPRSTFGLHRAEILAALVNALVLLGVCGYLAYAGISRLADPPSVDAGPMVAFAPVGLVANGVSLLS